jgi:hypothetical protein
MVFATGVEMDQIRKQLFACSRFAFDQDRGLRVCNTQCQLDRATYRRRLTDDPFLSVTLVQRAAQVHDFCRQLVALECGAYLIRDAFDECDFVILETFARLAPNESEQAKRMATTLTGATSAARPPSTALNASRHVNGRSVSSNRNVFPCASTSIIAGNVVMSMDFP